MSDTATFEHWLVDRLNQAAARLAEAVELEPNGALAAGEVDRVAGDGHRVTARAIGRCFADIARLRRVHRDTRTFADDL